MSIRIPAVCLTLLALGFVGPAARAADSSVDANLEKVLRDLTATYEKDPSASWRAMPDKFKKEIEAVWTDVLKKMDPELWDKSFEATAKALKVLKAKRKIILDMVARANLPPGLDKESIAEFYDAELDALTIMVDSDLAKLETARKIDIEKYMSDIARKTSKQMPAIQKFVGKLAGGAGAAGEEAMRASRIPGSTVGSVKMDGDEAIVKFKPAEGEAFEMTFAKYGGQWYPKQSGDMLLSGLPVVKETLAGINADTIKLFKPQVMQVLRKLDTGLDKVAATTTPQEFMDAVGALGRDLAGAAVPNQ
jgi:hypothetical protein